jgi:hypothetical protein
MRRLLTMATLVVAVALGLWLAVGASASPVHRATTGGVKTAAVFPASGQQVASTHRNGSTSASAKQVTGSKLSQAERAGESESAGENESGGETENGAAGEGDTHEDPAGQNVNHECPPNCDTANGEQP